MRKLLALAAVAALVVVSCNWPPPTGPDGGTTVNVNQNVTIGQPDPNASPSPGGSVARVGVGKVAETCPVGTQPSGLGNALRVGCTAFLTCSPYSASGQELFDVAIIGVAPESFEAISGGSVVQVGPHGSNPFNLDTLGLKAGSASFQCRVRGVTSPPFTLSVVQ